LYLEGSSILEILCTIAVRLVNGYKVIRNLGSSLIVNPVSGMVIGVSGVISGSSITVSGNSVGSCGGDISTVGGVGASPSGQTPQSDIQISQDSPASQ